MSKLLAIVLLLGCAVCAFAQTNDVPTDHWAYDSVKELMDRGYLIGYPDGMFNGERALNRYEFATVVARILSDVNQRLEAAGQKPLTNTTTQAPVAAKPEVTKQDVANVSKLVDEFKSELAVIGTRLDTTEATIQELKDKLDIVDAVLNDEEGALRSTMYDVNKMKKVTVGGYVQTRFQMINPADENKAEDAYYDTFLVRRARIKVTAKPTSRSTAVLQLDMGANNPNVKDAYFNYALGENSGIAPSFQIGQQNWWFGYEVPYSSSKRETPERALFVRRFFPGERDTGAVFMGPTEKNFYWVVGAYNGPGIENGKDSAIDYNDEKDFLGRVAWSFPTFDFGVSGYTGTGTWWKKSSTITSATGTPPPTTTVTSLQYTDLDKVRYGADFQWYWNRMTFKAEYIRGKGFDDVDPSKWDQGEWVDGYYAQINYNMSVNDTFVVRYTNMSQDPKKPAYGERTAWNIGYLRWLDSNSRFKLFYIINDEEFETDATTKDNDGFVAEWVVTY